MNEPLTGVMMDHSTYFLEIKMDPSSKKSRCIQIALSIILPRSIHHIFLILETMMTGG
jgi:hypothetical protein